MRKILKLLICISVALSICACSVPKTIVDPDVIELKKAISEVESFESIKAEHEFGRIYFKIYLNEGYTEEEINEIYEKVIEFTTVEKILEILEKLKVPESDSNVELEIYVQEEKVYIFTGSCYASNSKSDERDYDYYVWSGGKVEVEEDSTEETEGNEEETTEKQSGQKE